jgi:uncharacterized protein YndB with AHSA1/START domain
MITNPVTPGIEPVRKSIVVAVTPERAFTVFTQRTDAWWPFKGKSIFQERGRSVTYEPRVGGEVYETSVDGERGTWGRILAWSPPDSFRMTWHPGRDESTAQELEVRFVAVPEGTRVEIEHRGWEKLLDQGRASREGYDGGWIAVLDALVDACARGIA